MTLRQRLTRLHWRIRPGRFVPVDCGSVKLEDLARPVETHAALAGSAEAISCLELAPAGSARLDPWFELGPASETPVPREPCPVPPVRLYRFRGETRIFGKGLFLRAGEVVLLPRFEFCELGRLDYPVHRLSLVPRDGGREGEMTARMPGPLRHVEGPCLYLAQGGETVWGHWLVDMLPRLILGLAVPSRLRVVIDADTPSWAADMLAIAGIDRSRIVRHDKFRTALVVQDLYVPSFLRYGDAFSPLVDLAWGLLPASPEAADRRLYVSRSRGPGGSTLANAPEVEAAVRARGYRVVHAERLGVAAKSRLFSRASHVLGEYGSGMHNTVFSRAGTRVAVLQSVASPTYVQAGIGVRRGQPTGFAFGPSTDGARGFTLPLPILHETLDRLDAGSL